MTWKSIDSASHNSAQVLLGWRDAEGCDHVGEGYWDNGCEDFPDQPEVPAGWCVPGLNLFNSSLPTHFMDMPKLVIGKTKKRGDYEPEFLQKVWEPYPRKRNTSKINAWRKFSALSQPEQQQVIAAIPVYAASVRGKEEQYVLHLEFFISRRIFETVALPPPSRIGRDPAPPSELNWVAIMRAYGVTNNWNAQHGPPPGHPGCKVPPELASRRS